jgi:hypothetical protein
VAELNFIIAYGERLTERVPPPGRNPGEKQMPYTVDAARDRLVPQFSQLAQEIRRLPDLACPRDEAVAVLTMHPQFIAKSYFPHALLAANHLRAVGSRASVVQPEAWTRKRDPELSPTTELFVAGPRDALESLSASVSAEAEDSPVLEQLPRVEKISAPVASSRVRLTEEDADGETIKLEIVLHAGASDTGFAILAGFQAWATYLDARLDLDRRFDVGGLTFLPAVLNREVVTELARFSFLRVARSMPRLRTLRPLVVARSEAAPRASLPEQDPVDSDLRVAIFDGGLEESTNLSTWARPHEVSGIGAPTPDSLDHGYEVTGALLFGPFSADTPAPRPFSYVDHFRVLDDQTEDDPEELYDVLQRIRDVLSTRSYEYVNLSIGPCLPIEDDDVHGWTVALDALLADGKTLLTSAVGNWGERDRPSGNARVQPPGDGVNALGVGSADARGAIWERASYSCVGPGRSPGIVKPDVLAFGGSSAEPFFVLRREREGHTIGQEGTSYAAPLALRTALGARALLGAKLDPLALRALLIHASEAGGHGIEDVGWGRIPTDLEDIVVCAAGGARVLYQGILEPRRYLRAAVPLPARILSGRVTITTTIVYATPIDPAHSGGYTQAGLEVFFRPHSGRFAVEGGASVAKTSPFFQLGRYSEEEDLRRDAHKWETVLHRSKRFNGTSLQAPVFDIHYNARNAGSDTTTAPPIRYAAVITIDAPKEPNLYSEILAAYAGTLEALVPVVEIPLRVST